MSEFERKHASDLLSIHELPQHVIQTS